MTYVPFILIPSKEPGLIKLTSDALLFPLINGCRNHAKMHEQKKGGVGGKVGAAWSFQHTHPLTCHNGSAAAAAAAAGNNDSGRRHGYLPQTL